MIIKNTFSVFWKNAFMNTYGERLAEALTVAKKNRKDLADAMDISVQAIGDAIRGKTAAFTAENNAKAAKLLKVNPNWLAGMDEEMALPSADGVSNVQSALTNTTPSLAVTLAHLGELLQRASPKTRAVVADLLGRYAQDPINGKSIAQAIELLINAEAGEKRDT